MNRLLNYKIYGCFFVLFLISSISFGQSTNTPQSNYTSTNKFLYGGSLSLNIGNKFTDITLAPSVLYPFNEYFAAGVGLQGSYIDVKDNYQSFMYGGSVIAVANPLEFIQLSAELEQLRVNLKTDFGFKDNYWNTALFLGAGYRNQNVTIGIRYNVLFKDEQRVYTEAFMPFVRVYF